jgi:hypothetical protein
VVADVYEVVVSVAFVPSTFYSSFLPPFFEDAFSANFFSSFSFLS